MSTGSQHPSQRFEAPSGILKAVPLKEMFNASLVRLIGESFADVLPGFNRKEFQTRACKGLEALEFSARARHIGLALAEQLPQPFERTSDVLVAAMGPELTTTERNGLGVFFYLPHAYVISETGVDDFDSGMRANYELTKRFSAEFSIRPFLVKHRDRALKLLAKWTRDPNPHVRRLVSEGTRPRLPWAMRLKELQENPLLALPLLEKLKDDPELYVRRSVANHLGDVLKDHPEVVYEVCERWLAEANAAKFSPEKAKARKWIIRHAVRHPAKKSDPRATTLRAAAK